MFHSPEEFASGQGDSLARIQLMAVSSKSLVTPFTDVVNYNTI